MSSSSLIKADACASNDAQQIMCFKGLKGLSTIKSKEMHLLKMCVMDSCAYTVTIIIDLVSPMEGWKFWEENLLKLKANNIYF